MKIIKEFLKNKTFFEKAEEYIKNIFEVISTSKTLNKFCKNRINNFKDGTFHLNNGSIRVEKGGESLMIHYPYGDNWVIEIYDPEKKTGYKITKFGWNTIYKNNNQKYNHEGNFNGYCKGGEVTRLVLSPEELAKRRAEQKPSKIVLPW